MIHLFIPGSKIFALNLRSGDILYYMQNFGYLSTFEGNKFVLFYNETPKKQIA